ncbi:MAG: hypothetical protein JXA50_01650 [Deltaproteobacteria bacterium]|nr:hypothetical protein [Deltaproteobacteria bacterium]
MTEEKKLHNRHLKIEIDGQPIVDKRIGCDHRWGDGPGEYEKTLTIAEGKLGNRHWRLDQCDICKVFVLFINGEEYWTFPTGRMSLSPHQA